MEQQHRSSILYFTKYSEERAPPLTRRFLRGGRGRTRARWWNRTRKIEPYNGVRLQSPRRIEGYRGAIDI